jgi:hypothetical protein
VQITVQAQWSVVLQINGRGHATDEPKNSERDDVLKQEAGIKGK